MRSLIISIASLLALSSCAPVVVPQPVVAAPVVLDHDRFREAPDGQGLFITLDDAYAEVVEREQEKRDHKVQVIRLTGAVEMAQAQQKLADDLYNKERATVSSWLSRWGLPVGLATGFLGGIITTFLVARSMQ